MGSVEVVGKRFRIELKMFYSVVWLVVVLGGIKNVQGQDLQMRLYCGFVLTVVKKNY